MKLISGDAESQATEYEVPADVAVESNEGYTLSFSEDTVWTVPNQPAVVTVTLTDANGEVVDPSEYKLLLESDAQNDEDTKVEINGHQITVTQTDDWEEDVVIYAMESGSEASGAETRSAAVSQDTDGPLKLYKVATLRIRPESERPAAAIRRQRRRMQRVRRNCGALCCGRSVPRAQTEKEITPKLRGAAAHGGTIPPFRPAARFFMLIVD